MTDTHQKRADELRVGDKVTIGTHIRDARVVHIIRETPRVLLIHVKEERHTGLPWVYRKRANTLVTVLA